MVKYGAVVVGAGIIGLSTAYHMKNEYPNAKILVVDKYNAVWWGSMAKSAFAFRCFFSFYTNYMLSRSSIIFTSIYRKIRASI